MSILKVAKVIVFSAAAVGFVGGAEAANLFFEGDMVRGQSQDYTTGPTCVLNSQFMRQEHVVWRVRVLDETGAVVDGEGLKSLVIEISDGQQFAAKFGTHPRRDPTDSFWATSWAIPADYPTGTIGYKVIATDGEGNVHEWKPFNVNLSSLTIIPGEATLTPRAK